MLEIILLVYLCGRIGRIVEPKGHRSGWYKFFLVISWFGGEFAGGLFAALILALLAGDNEPSLGMVYLFALGGAIVGVVIVFQIAKRLPDLRADLPQDPFDVSAFKPIAAVPEPRESGNPYQPPFSAEHGNLYDPAGLPTPPPAHYRKHSGLGIASFVIALLVGVLEFAVIIAAGIMETSAPGGMDEDSPAVMAVGFAICFGVLMHVMGLILGIVGVAQSGRNRVFAILGSIFNGVILIGIGLLMLVGISME